MESEDLILGKTSQLGRSHDNTISILVVDDDTTCLAVAAALLKRSNYEVVTVKHPVDALCILRIRRGGFDLVVSDVYMPGMNGFQLQQVIKQEFKVPVVLMSADNSEEVMLEGLSYGAAFFIVKPLSLDNVRDLWKFADRLKKSEIVTKEAETSQPRKTLIETDSDDITITSSSVNKCRIYKKKDPKGKAPKRVGNDDELSQVAPKKVKVIWTNALHNRFLEAIKSIGLDRAVPKKIMEVMNVPGLTRENVASHLQKYWIFLKRVADASSKIQYTSDSSLPRRSILRPSVASGPGASLHWPFQPNTPSANASFPSQEGSSTMFITQLGFGQSRLLSNQGSFLKPNLGNQNMVHQANQLGFRSNNPLFLTSAYNPSQFKIGTSSTQMWTTPAFFKAPEVSTNRLPRFSNSVAGEGNSRNHTLTHQNNSNSTILAPLKNCNIDISNASSGSKNEIHGSNYVGYELSDISHLLGSRHAPNENLRASNSFDNLWSFIDGFQSKNLDASVMPNYNTSSLMGHDITCSPMLDAEIQLSNIFPDEIHEFSAPLLPEHPPLLGNTEIGEDMDPLFYEMLDLSTLDIMSSELGDKPSNPSRTFSEKVSIQSPLQSLGAIAGSSNFSAT